MKKSSLVIVLILLFASTSFLPTGQITTAPLKRAKSIVPTIWVTRPLADVTWFSGSGNRYRVEWTTSGTQVGASVHIHLCDETGNRILGHLAANTPNDGSENVEPDSNQAEGKIND